MSLISNIRVAGSGQIVPAEIYPCELRDLQLWQRDIQTPFIAPTGVIGAEWDWPALFIGCNAIETAAGRQAITFQIRVEGPQGQGVPVVQSIVSLGYPFPGNTTGSPRQRCVFVWFVAAAPATALQSLGISHRFATLAPVLDTAIQLSLSHGMDGRVGLHAAVGTTAKQSADLVQVYIKHGLKLRNSTKGYFRVFRREDGRLFYFDPPSAATYASAQNDLR